jgi:hypothetical protein
VPSPSANPAPLLPLPGANPAVSAPLPPLPAGNTTAMPPLPLSSPSYSTFKEAVTAGATAVQEKRWQDAKNAFNASLPLAQTDAQKAYAGKWLQYVNGQTGGAEPPLPAQPAAAPKAAPAPPSASALPEYKGVKWGATVSEFAKLKKIRAKSIKGLDFQGTEQAMVSAPMDLLLSNFKGTLAAGLSSVYVNKDGVYYLFYKNRFFMVGGALDNGDYQDILGLFKAKYTYVKSFRNPSQDALGLKSTVEYTEFQSGDGVRVFLIRNTCDYSGEIAVGTSFAYVPKDKLEEIQDAAVEKVKDADSDKKSMKAAKLKRDKGKL